MARRCRNGESDRYPAFLATWPAIVRQRSWHADREREGIGGGVCIRKSNLDREDVVTGSHGDAIWPLVSVIGEHPGWTVRVVAGESAIGGVLFEVFVDLLSL